MVVYGCDKLDEISLSAPTAVCEFGSDYQHCYEVKPEDFGVERCDKMQLRGGDPSENARILRGVLEGRQGPQREIVALNAGAAFYITRRVNSWKDGVELARKVIDDGRARETLERFIQESQRV